MPKEIGKKLKQALFYICLFVLFRTSFVLITPYYLNPSSGMHVPIDARTSDWKFFDAAYVREAKNSGYNVSGYFDVYLPLDLAFPAIYTMMFLTILAIFKDKNFYKILRYFVFAGMILDYLENLSFCLYLKSSDEISLLVASFTTIKSFVFVLNFLFFVIGFIWASILFFQTRTYQKA